MSSSLIREAGGESTVLAEVTVPVSWMLSLIHIFGEVGQNIFCAQQTREDGGGLVDDGHIRDDVDDPLHLLGGGVLDVYKRQGLRRCGGSPSTAVPDG